MSYLIRGALVEYASDFLGPLPNVVIFQFNPETLVRSLQIPPRPTGAEARETTQAGEIPVERITLTAHFSAADALGAANPIAALFGVGPQLAALEQMVYPSSKLSGLIGQAIDAIGSALGIGGSDPPAQPIPRQSYPRLLFIWGPARVWPVVIDSMSITEQQFDGLLNPIQAEVNIGLTINALDPCTDDKIAKGAWEYSSLAKEAQATVNLANTAAQIVDLIPF
jgi:hypothetical protein